jgi:hypothetical protein
VDLAVDVAVKDASSKQRTGTEPFMAVDLLEPDPPAHMYRHDLESMFYVIIWITSRFHDGKEITNPPLQAWADEGGASLVKEKSYFIMSRLAQRTAKFNPLTRWVVSMQTIVRDGFSARTRWF